MSHWIVTTIGIFASGLQMAMNINIFYRDLIQSPAWTKHDFRFIIFRTFLDILQGFASLTLYSFTIFYVLYPDLISYNYIFVSGLILTNITIIRSFLAAGIAVERCIASCFPVQFFQHRQKIPNTPLVLFFIFTAFFDDFMLFHLSGLTFPLNSANCATYLCALPQKYWKLAAIYSAVYGFINYIFSFILCFKLLSMYFRKLHYSADLKKVNLLCLTDGLSSIIFDLIPAILFQTKTINVENDGPVTGVLRTIGRVLEAMVMYKLMKKKIRSPNSNSMLTRTTLKERTTTRHK
ncbi:unnamed protein product [Caenorhabditis angaria]|uniref:Serpentine Receptor, class BC (Class B-like) n=1 Tax=Caenorhabditis angaria TaxID=860376 RepID=A0A9P1IXI5_9PELO|nr:unnamed protein product [Caenorhabditis angaria]